MSWTFKHWGSTMASLRLIVMWQLSSHFSFDCLCQFEPPFCFSFSVFWLGLSLSAHLSLPRRPLLFRDHLSVIQHIHPFHILKMGFHLLLSSAAPARDVLGKVMGGISDLREIEIIHSALQKVFWAWGALWMELLPLKGFEYSSSL